MDVSPELLAEFDFIGAPSAAVPTIAENNGPLSALVTIEGMFVDVPNPEYAARREWLTAVYAELHATKGLAADLTLVDKDQFAANTQDYRARVAVAISVFRYDSYMRERAEHIKEAMSQMIAGLIEPENDVRPIAKYAKGLLPEGASVDQVAAAIEIAESELYRQTAILAEADFSNFPVYYEEVKNAFIKLVQSYDEKLGVYDVDPAYPARELLEMYAMPALRDVIEVDDAAKKAVSEKVADFYLIDSTTGQFSAASQRNAVSVVPLATHITRLRDDLLTNIGVLIENPRVDIRPLDITLKHEFYEWVQNDLRNRIRTLEHYVQTTPATLRQPAHISYNVASGEALTFMLAIESKHDEVVDLTVELRYQGLGRSTDESLGTQQVMSNTRLSARSVPALRNAAPELYGAGHYWFVVTDRAGTTWTTVAARVDAYGICVRCGHPYDLYADAAGTCMWAEFPINEARASYQRELLSRYPQTPRFDYIAVLDDAIRADTGALIIAADQLANLQSTGKLALRNRYFSLEALVGRLLRESDARITANYGAAALALLKEVGPKYTSSTNSFVILLAVVLQKQGKIFERALAIAKQNYSGLDELRAQIETLGDRPQRDTINALRDLLDLYAQRAEQFDRFIVEVMDPLVEPHTGDYGLGPRTVMLAVLNRGDVPLAALDLASYPSAMMYALCTDSEFRFLQDMRSRFQHLRMAYGQSTFVISDSIWAPSELYETQGLAHVLDLQFAQLTVDELSRSSVWFGSTPVGREEFFTDIDAEGRLHTRIARAREALIRAPSGYVSVGNLWQGTHSLTNTQPDPIVVRYADGKWQATGSERVTTLGIAPRTNSAALQSAGDVRTTMRDPNLADRLARLIKSKAADEPKAERLALAANFYYQFGFLP